MEAKLGSGDAQLLREDMAKDATEEREVEATVALAVAKLERNA
jgi:hypothetical protein